MVQKCGTYHPILQHRLKQLFKKRWKLNLTRNLVCAFFATAMSDVMAVPMPYAMQTSMQASAQKELPPAQNLLHQRSSYAAAEQRIRNLDEHEYAQLQQEFAGYPLWIYLEAEYLQRNLSMQQEAYLLSFMQRYYGSPPERQVRDAWLAYLARRNDAERYTRDYVARGNTEQECRYLGFRLAQNPDTQALADEIWPQVTRRWVQAVSQPKVCNPVFKQWVNAEQRTQAVVWQRFDAALNAGIWNIARYTRSLLSDRAEPGATELASQLMALRQRPQRGLSQWAKLPHENPRVREHLYMALQQLSWADIDRTQAAWQAMRGQVTFSVQQQQVIDSQIGVVLAVRNEPEARDWFNSIDTSKLGPSAQHWYLATLLRSADFASVLEFTEHMDAGAQRDYWQARALSELGRHLEAESIWQALAEARHYYGFMAAAYLGMEPNLERYAVEVDPEAMQQLKGRMETQRAHEFLQLGRYFDARREWNLVRARVTEDERVAAAILAEEWGWLDQSIRELASLGLTHDLERRFPIGFAEELVRETNKNNIDMSWALAIIRRESAFQVDAVSPVGARGLMQIMPSTAEHIQRTTSLARSPQRAANLHNPSENIRYGTHYLSELLRRNNGNWLLATASYNAGLQRVREWVPDAPIAVDVWIETIPFQETRDYVKAVLTYQQIYVSLLGRDDKLLEHMHSMLLDPEGELCDHVERESPPIAVC